MGGWGEEYLQQGGLGKHVEPLHRASVLGEVVQRGVAEEDGAHRVGHPSHQQFLVLEPAAEQQRKVSREGKRLGRALVRGARPHGGGGRGGQPAHEAQAKVGEDVTHHLEELRPELGGRVGLVRLERGDERQHVRVAAGHALPDDHEGARHDVGALDRDANRRAHPRVAEEVGLAAADAGAAQDVHPVLHHLAPALGARLLHDGRQHHRGLVVVDDGVGELHPSHHRIRLAAAPAERLLDAAKLGDGDLELLAHAGIRADARHHAPGGPDGTGGQSLNHHVPSKAAASLPAEHRGHRDPDVVALDRAVHEGAVQRHVPWAHPQALVPPLEQGHRKALLSGASEQPRRVLQVEADTHHAGHRCQSDVTLAESGADPKLVPALLDHAKRALQRRCIGPVVRARQPKARDKRAVGEPREEIALLLVGAVAHEELARAQRVGHRHRRVGVGTVRRDLGEHS
eukprot:scaffold7551_cov123-Isochrysis_galbana.AAC.19